MVGGDNQYRFGVSLVRLASVAQWVLYSNTRQHRHIIN